MAAASTLDEELVARAQAGDVDAYALLVQRYQPIAVGLAALVMSNPAEADDVAQEAFLKAYYALGRFKPGGSFRAWLVQIVVNEARNARGAANRRANLHGRFRDDVARKSVAVSAEDTAIAVEERNALLLALDGLREDDRSVLIFRYVFDLSEAEMAEVLACSPGTVKSRLSRALARLRSDLSRVAPLLAVSPILGQMVGHTLTPAAISVAGASARALADAVVGHIAAGAGRITGLGGSGSGARPSSQQVVVAATAVVGCVAVVVTGLLLSTLGDRSTVGVPSAIPSPVRVAGERVAAASPVPPSNPSAPTVFVVYGGDLTDSQRQELSTTLADGSQRITTDTVTRAELLSTLQAAGLAVDGAERAVSSAAVTCLSLGDGLRVRTQNVTVIPAAVYANALVTAGLVDAEVVVAAPPSTPMTGETALVGVLKAYPQCHAGQAVPAERLAVAYDQLHVTADIAQSSGAWDKAAALMLRASQTAISSHAPDEVALGSAVDAAASTEGVTLSAQQRTEIVSILGQLASLDQGIYAAGYVVEQVAANEARVAPNSAGPHS